MALGLEHQEHTEQMFGVLAQKIANKPFTIVGSGSQTRDFTYVSDIVNAFVRPLNQK